MAETELAEKIKRKYAGKWIGLKGEDIVAISDTHDEIYEQLKEKNASDVYVFYSPTEEEKKYSFLF